MDFDSIKFIYAEPEEIWFKDIVYEALRKLPRELFGEPKLWDRALTQFPFIRYYNPAEAKDIVIEINEEKKISNEVIFPLDSSDSEENFKKFVEMRPLRILLAGDESKLFYEVGELLADNFKTYHLRPRELIKKHIVARTHIGDWIYWNIKNGKGIPIWLVMKLLQVELKRDRYLHKGFILSGFPIIPEMYEKSELPCDLREDDTYVRFDDIDNLVEEEYVTELNFHSASDSTVQSDSDVAEEPNIRNVSFVYIDGDETSLSQSCVKSQLDWLYHGWNNSDYVVYLDTHTYTKKFEGIIDVLQRFILFHNRENVIRVDCRIGMDEIFNSICRRFMYISYKLNYECVLLNTQNNSELCLKDLCSQDLIFPGCKWWISRFGVMCPVNLYYGRTRFCDCSFPVRYLKYIFLCHSSEARNKFVIHPGKYIKLKPPCRIAIIGPHRTGKSTLSNCIARYLKADIYRAHIDGSAARIADVNSEQLTDKALVSEFKNLETLRLKDCSALKTQKIKEWSTCVLPLINEVVANVLGAKDKFSFSQQVEKYYENGDDTASNEALKQLVMENAVFNEALRQITASDFLNWTSLHGQPQEKCKQYVLDAPPLNMSFWQQLLDYDELPDCVFFVAAPTLEKMIDIYSLIHTEACILDEVICENLCSAFSEWKNHFKDGAHHKSTGNNRVYEKYNNHLVDLRYNEAVKFTEKYAELKSFLKKHNVICIDIDISKNTWSQTILKALTEYLNNYTIKPLALHQQFALAESETEDGNEENLSEGSHKSLLENGSAISDYDLSPSTQLGHTLDYCPVFLKNQAKLLKGDVRYAAEYNNKTYLMHSKDALQDFLVRPLKFVKDNLVIPPPRIYIAGLEHYSKTKFGETLAYYLNVNSGSYSKNLHRMSLKSFLNEEFCLQLIVDSYEQEKDQVLSNLAAIYEKGVVVIGFPLFAAQFEQTIANGLYPESVVILDDQEKLLNELYRRLTRLHVLKHGLVRNCDESLLGLRKASATPELEPVSESSDEFIRTKSENVVQSFLQELHKIEELCRRYHIPVIKIPKNRKRTKQIIVYADQINLLRDRGAMFENVKTISMEESQTLVMSGYYRFSRFKRSCPVAVSRLITLNHFEGYRLQGCVYPCIYGDFIYFICGKSSLKDFQKNPLKYVNSCNPPQMQEPIRVAVFGSPNSGVSTVCDAISKEFGLKVFSSKSISKDHSPSTVIDLLKMNRSATHNGIILDNIPLTPLLLQQAARSSVDLTVVFVLVTSFDRVLDNWYEKNKNKKNCPRLMLLELNRKFIETQKAIQRLRTCPETAQFNIHYLDGDANSWTTWESIKHKLIKTARCISGYRLKLAKGRLANLGHLNFYYDCVTFRREIAHFYCQVCLDMGKLNAFKYYYVNVPLEFYSTECQELLNKPYGYANDYVYKKFNFTSPFQINEHAEPIKTQKRHFMCTFQYKDLTYWTCSDHTVNFMLDTIKFYNNVDNLKPMYIPFLVIGYLRSFVALEGFCPVEYAQGRFVRGKMDLSAYYRKKVYLMASKENTIKFLSYPETYRKLRFSKRFYLLSQQPSTFCGLKEETVSAALVELATVRPKHFALTAEQSAGTYVGLKLKYNVSLPRLKDYWGTATRSFVRDCKKLNTELKKYRESINPFILYEEE